MKSYPESLGLVCSIPPDGVQPKPLVLSRGIPLVQSMFRQHPVAHLVPPPDPPLSGVRVGTGGSVSKIKSTLYGLRRMYRIACYGCGPRTPFPALHP